MKTLQMIITAIKAFAKRVVAFFTFGSKSTTEVKTAPVVTEAAYGRIMPAYTGGTVSTEEVAAEEMNEVKEAIVTEQAETEELLEEFEGVSVVTVTDEEAAVIMDVASLASEHEGSKRSTLSNSVKKEQKRVIGSELKRICTGLKSNQLRSITGQVASRCELRVADTKTVVAWVASKFSTQQELSVFLTDTSAV